MKGNFQIIVLVIFIVGAIFGVLVFSGAIPIGKSSAPGALGTITVWGTVPSDALAKPLVAFNSENPTFVVKYVQKSADTFDQDLLEALATGTGPDLFFLPDDLAYSYSNKILTIPYTSYPLVSFQGTFAGAGSVFLTDKGMLAFPMSIDPLMMYYNRSMLDANDIVYPPTTWDDLSAMVPTLTQKDNSGTITKSAVALGQFNNITNAKDIIATLFMQAGSPIVTEQNGNFLSAIDPTGVSYNLSSTLKFYTDFTDPNDPLYSWNSSFPDSSDDFSNGNLAFYFGFASELPSLVNKNPNQDFFVAPIPQVKGSNTKVTDAHVIGIAISSASKNPTLAFTAANAMATGDFAAAFATATGTVPARRDLLAVKPTSDAYTPYFYSSALFAKSWLDPSSADTDNIFSGMINAVLSGTLSVGDTIKDADSKMNLLLLNSNQ
ncbi:MAG: extracellular solute-binding protein [Candidatus Pacebacteria bacterium]|nr:extracellular solute-binding protein [Candidatus Paceibacterota bacterium]